MIFTSFKLENFRGISQPVEIDLTKGNTSFPFVLVGNNESGKTTILKGIHYISVLCQGETLSEDFFTFIRPKRAFFNDKVTLSACISYDVDDMKALKFHKKIVCGENKKNDQGTFELSFVYEFKKSACIEDSIYINGTKVQKSHSIMIWIRKRLAEIVYYDDFIFDVPEKIRFLKKSHNGDTSLAQDALLTSPINLQWQKIFNDLLIGGHMNDNNIKNKEKNLDISFQEDIVDCDDNDAVKQRIGLINGYLKSVVKEGWVDITEGKSLFDDCIIEKSNSDHDTDSGFVDYCLQIKANNLFFYLHERSKGFRWFFCFKVLTEVRRHRSKNGIVFLLDEPANNLHIHPQRKILSSLQTLSSIKGNKVIYSTHSPYLINDDNWDNLFTVRNEANDFEAPRIVCERFLELTTSTEETVRAVEPIVQKTWITHLGTGADWIIKKFNGVAANAKKVNHIADCVKHVIGG